MSWHMVEVVALRVARILLVALLGAMLDAGLLDGQLGAGLVDALPASLSKSSAVRAEWVLPLSPLA